LVSSGILSTTNGVQELGVQLVTPAILLTSQQKQNADNVSSVLSAIVEALGVLSFNSISEITPSNLVIQTLNYLGLFAGYPNPSATFITQQTLNNIGVILAGVTAATVCPLTGGWACPAAIAGFLGAIAVDLSYNLVADPPDQNYQQVYVPVITTSPIPLTVPCGDLNSAANAAAYALGQEDEWLNAAHISDNRYQTAISAGDTGAAAMQGAAFLSYVGSSNDALGAVQSTLTCFTSALQAAGIGTQIPTSQDETAALAALETSDPSSLEAFLDSIGLSDVDVAALIEQVEADPPPFPTEPPIDTLDSAVYSLTGNVPSNVPEPSTLFLFCPALVILFALRTPLITRFRSLVKPIIH
jgi:hypothetical protein